MVFVCDELRGYLLRLLFSYKVPRFAHSDLFLRQSIISASVLLLLKPSMRRDEGIGVGGS